ncbi:unnamed protein product [Echinostoma caproni]|uniref:Uncharacterized protein n=1 Tax=Echinostoma caproni TaxID=27848 RepID=A0A3P8BG89_9TREM|nr:unnamed protein product [Echinostoma caproni]
MWNLSSSLASLVVAPFDYVHRILQMASRSFSEASTRGLDSTTFSIGVTNDSFVYTRHRRRRTRTDTDIHAHPQYHQVASRPIPVHHHHPHHSLRCRCTIPNCPTPWTTPMARTSTPASMTNVRRPLSTDSSSCVRTASTTDETRNTDYIFQFE